jgi:hypothetical protein
VTTGSSGSLWGRFEYDPRDPAYAAMRASDRDRGVVHDVLASAYAEGRLDRDELDDRTTEVDRAKTYGDLVAPLRDLTADVKAPVLRIESHGELHRMAEARYREERKDALMGVLVPNLICWAIWYMTGHDAFIWPVFVLIPTLGNFVRVAASKESIVEARVQKLERKQTKALESPKPDQS